VSPRVKKSLHELRTTGFAKLRDGRIHVRCPDCGRKQSNAARLPDQDPSNATLIEVVCARCGQGCKDPESFWFDAEGNEIRWDGSDAGLALLMASPTSSEEPPRP
jgi:hypothetical protein